jgi:hypothetical protein
VRKLLTGTVTSATLFAVSCLAPAISQAAPCDGVGAEQPFLEWHDQAAYVLVSGGDFESAAAGWTLSGDAAVVSEGNTLRPASSANSLSLPAGAAATTPPTCVGKGDPVARIFMRTLTPGERGPNSLKVEILYLDTSGAVRKVKKAGSLHASDEWTPSRRFSLAVGQVSHSAKPPSTVPDHGHGGGPKPSRSGEIQLRFTALAGSEWQIDDVFVDPSARR